MTPQAEEIPGEISRVLEKNTDKILATYNILKIATNIKEFDKYLKKYHNTTYRRRHIFNGYKFFLETALRVLYNAIELDTTLGLEEDFTFTRARFAGINIADVPPTCEKTNFLKNFWASTRPVRRAKSWKQIEEALISDSFKSIISPLEKLYKRSEVNLQVKLPKRDVLNAITAFYLNIFFNDASRGFPLGHILPSTLPTNLTEKRLQKAINGYVLTLQYVWYKTLGEEKFTKSCIRNIHHVLNEDVSEPRDGDDSAYRLLQIFPQQEAEELKEWYRLDKYFGKIREEIVVPLEKQLGIDIAFDPALKVRKPGKDLFKHFLKSSPAPKYVSQPDKYPEKYLDSKFLWYDHIEVLSQTGEIFSGVPAFVSTLLGIVTLRGNEPVIIKVFKHPDPSVNGNDYSYGILINVFGSSGISDYSGWLIFYDCATDYSGFGGSLYQEAHMWIQKLQKKGKVDVEEIEIDKETFRKYLEKKASRTLWGEISQIEPQQIPLTILEFQEKMKQRLEEFKNNVKGLLFELLVYKTLVESRQYDKVRHSKGNKAKEADILAYNKDGDKEYLFECTVRLHKDRDKLSQIQKKVELRKKDTHREIVPILVTYFDVDDDIKKKYAKHGIEIQDNYKLTILQHLPKDRRKQIEQIFEK